MRSRNQNTRSAVKRPQNYVPPGSVPPIPPDALGPEWRLFWKRRFINSALEDKDHFFDEMQAGWLAVKPEELPPQFGMDRYKDADQNIRWKGCILCKRDAKLCEYDQSYWEDMASGNLTSAESEYLKDRNEYVPKFSEGGKRKVIRGSVPY